MHRSQKLLLVLALLTLAACASPYRRLQMYAGSPKPDHQLAAIINGGDSFGGAYLNALLVGVDDAPCLNPDYASSPGLPPNTCGNNTLIEPGRHRFRVVLQTPNKVTLNFSYGVSRNSFQRSQPFFTDFAEIEAGMLYEVVPVQAPGGLSAKVVAICKSTNHEESARSIRVKKICV